MAELLGPWIYLEILRSPPTGITGASFSTGAFIGSATKGPFNKPILVTSPLEFVKKFGTFRRDDFLAYDVYGFFLNGGGRCYVVRVNRPGATVASITVDDGDPNNPTAIVRFKAKWPGSSGNDITVKIDPNVDPTLVNITVTETSTGTTEFYPDISFNRNSSRYVVMLMMGSELVEVEHLTPNSATLPRTGTFSLQGGTDGSDPQQNDWLAAIDAFDPIEEILNFGVGGLFPAAQHYLVGKAITKRNWFVFLNTTMGVNTREDAAAYKNGSLQNVNTTAFTSEYCALYYPWLKIIDPLSGFPITVPPAAWVAGAHARNDQNEGPHVFTAGIGYGEILGVFDTVSRLTKADIDYLYPRGVNPILNDPRTGLVIWGSQTALPYRANEKWIPTIRMSNFISTSIYNALFWVVHKRNTPELWAQVSTQITNFMDSLFRRGWFAGATPSEAYFVRVDESNNPPSMQEQGILVVDVGFAPFKPVEFVIVRISREVSR